MLDEIEDILKIQCAPITWPIGMGKIFKGIYHLYEDRVYLFEHGKSDRLYEEKYIDGLDNPELDKLLDGQAQALRDEIHLVKGASHEFDKAAYLAGKQTPVFFGTALSTFGVRQMLNLFVEDAPAPMPRATKTRDVVATEDKFSGFVFKIQANMDPLIVIESLFYVFVLANIKMA